MTDLSQYDYELPRELIAQHALSCRSELRLLVVSRGTSSLQHAHVRDLPEYLVPGDCLVLNDTREILAARLQGYRTRTGGRWSGLFVTSDSAGHWEVLGKTRGRLSVGESVMLQDRQAEDAFCLRFVADLGEGLWAVQPDDPGTTPGRLAACGPRSVATVHPWR